jgi:protein-arginine kinase activator protein McsA
MKYCKKCNTLKEESCFYKYKKAKDGLRSWCKLCCSNNSKNYYVEHREIIIEQTTIYSLLNRDKESFKNKANKASTKYKKENPLKDKARRLVYRAIQKSILVKPDICSTCGTPNNQIEAHHDNYNYPLVVRWLCKNCHAKWHNFNKPIGEI